MLVSRPPLPPTTLSRYWFVNRRGAINIEFEDGSNIAEVRVREGLHMIVKRVEMYENGGLMTTACSPPQTWQWKAIADACFVPDAKGWKHERDFA